MPIKLARRNRPAALLAAVLLALPALAACGDDEVSPSDQTHTAPSGAEYNDADVAFATDMIPHHAQATQMVNMARGRDLDAQVQAIADGILAAQVPEVETMVDWLTDWGKDVPPTAMDHANAHGDGGMKMDTDMPGMMSEDQMDELESVRDSDFQSMWLEMMIEHHEGALEMAETEIANGHFPEAVAMAKSIQESQAAEIEQMQRLLGS